MTAHTSATPQNSNRLILAILAALWTEAFAAAMLYGRFLGEDWPGTMLTVAASSGFLALAIIAGALRHRYGRFMLAGLALCWLGDLVGPRHFVAGSTAFLLSHFLFMAAFAGKPINSTRLWRAAVLFCASGVGLVCWLQPHVHGAMTVLVYAYLLVITAMVVMACGVSTGNPFILLGAILFFISDIFVARWKFVDSSSINALFCYPMYYTACALLAFSILREPDKPQA